MKIIQELINEGRPKGGRTAEFSKKFAELLKEIKYAEMQDPEIDSVITDALRQLYYGVDTQVASESIRNFCDDENI